jgi:hypothetical protein
MLTGYNTDIRHGELVLHVQTEDKGRDNPAIESVIYLKGRVLAAKRTPYAKLIDEGKGEREIASLMEQQHRTILAAIRSGRFDQKIEEAVGGGGGARRGGNGAEATVVAAPAEAAPGKAAPVASEPPAGREPLPPSHLTAAAAADESGPTLDQVILEYLETEAEQEHLVLVLDGSEEIRPGRVNRVTLRSLSSRSGQPVARTQVSVRMLSTLSDPRTLLLAETDEAGTLELELDVPSVQGGSAALIIAGNSDLGRAEIKQLL